MRETAYRTHRGNPEQLGIRVNDGGINFAVAIPDDLPAQLVLTDRTGRVRQKIELPAEERVGEVSAVFVEGISAENCGYFYSVNGKIQTDPYAGMIDGTICLPVDESYDWQGDRSPDIPQEDLLIYKLHVRGFTKKAGPEVRRKGTFAGVTEKLPYILDMGFNAVELMPAYEWDDTLKVQPFARNTVGERGSKPKTRHNYWGYAEKNFYFAPKSSYAFSDNAADEFRDLVRSFHAAGVEVIMEMYFPESVDPCLAVQAVRHWKTVYHIDGFHLIGGGVPREALIHDALLKKTKLLFDYLDEGKLFEAGAPKRRRLFEYHNAFLECGRALLKSDEGQTARFASLIRRNPATHGVVNYLANVNGFTLMDAVSYDWKHNEENGEDNRDGTDFNYSWNCGIEGPSRRRKVADLRGKQLKNAFLYLFLSQGTPLVYAGDEMMNTQKGNNNAYALDDSRGWVDWNTGKDAAELRNFVKRLISFRKEHRIFHMSRELRGTDYRSTGAPDISYHDYKAWVCTFENVSRTLAVMYNGLYTHEENCPEEDFYYVAYNSHWEAHEFALPDLPRGRHWYPLIDSAETEGFLPESEISADDRKYFTAAPRSVRVYEGRV